MTVAQGTDLVYEADGRKLRDTLTGPSTGSGQAGSSHAVRQSSDEPAVPIDQGAN